MTTINNKKFDWKFSFASKISKVWSYLKHSCSGKCTVPRQNVRRQNVRRDKTSGDKTSGDKTPEDITSVGQNVRRDKTSVETKRP